MVMKEETDVKDKMFSKKWWDQFNIKSRYLSIPLVVENAVKDNVVELKNGIYEMLQNLDNDPNFKSWGVWVNGKQNDEKGKTLLKDPIKNENDLIPWQKRNFGDEKFGIILNDGQRYSDNVREIITKCFTPFFENNAPFGGVNFSIFIGNYGWTPIGIHEDHKGSFVMHFHLGPGRKTMYMWERSNYIKNLEGKENEKFPNEYLAFADYKCHFEEGDLFFMPWNYYHIGKSDELSLGLTVWVNYSTVDGVLNGIWENGFKGIKQSEENLENVIPNFMSIEDSTGMDLILSHLDEELAQLGLNDFISEELEDYSGALISNNWYDKGAVKKEKVNVEINEVTRLAINKSKIHYSCSGDTIKIFHRGNKVSFIYHQDIEKLIKSLNTGNTNRVKNILSDLFLNWPEEVGIRLLEVLYENDILQIIQE